MFVWHDGTWHFSHMDWKWSSTFSVLQKKGIKSDYQIAYSARSFLYATQALIITFFKNSIEFEHVFLKKRWFFNHACQVSFNKQKGE